MGRLSTVGLDVPTSLAQLNIDIENISCLFIKHATLMRRSTVLSLPLQLVFPGRAHPRMLYLSLACLVHYS